MSSVSGVTWFSCCRGCRRSPFYCLGDFVCLKAKWVFLVVCLCLDGLCIFCSNTELMPAQTFPKHGVGSSETFWRFLVVLFHPEARQELEK